MAVVTYLDGWYDEEHDGARSFRWMSQRVRCRIAGVSGAGPFWLQLRAGHGFEGHVPALSVYANNRLLASRAIPAHCPQHVFAVEAAPEFDLVLEVDSTFAVPSDARTLGLMVEDIAIIDANAVQRPVDAEGWYAWGDQEYFPCRWMAGHAVLLLPGPCLKSHRFAALPVYSDVADGSQTLTVRAGTCVLAEIRLLPGWHVYDLVLPARATDTASVPVPLSLVFELNRLAPPDPNFPDARTLGVRAGEIELHGDARRHARTRAFYEAAWKAAATGEAPGTSELDRARARTGAYFEDGGEGWYQWEFQDHVPFRWMGLRSRIHVPASEHRGRRFCTFEIFSNYDDLSQVATFTAAGRVIRLPLIWLWDHCSLEFGQSPDEDLEIVVQVNKLMPETEHRPDEKRELAIRLGPLLFHDDERRHDDIRTVYENAVLNTREFLDGATVLQSYPRALGIDLYGKCNIKPPCVYCWWEDMKTLEGDTTGAVVDETTLQSYGPFFRAASSLTNCSFGEPLLHPRLGQVLQLLADRFKLLDLSTNGQAFTPATVEALAGKAIILYVSIDAASAETYSRLRNDRWHEVITGLTFLREARRRANGLPKLSMVFMPMRANLQDLEAYFKLCRMMDADYLVLRALSHGNKMIATAERAGYHFDYQREILSFDEMEAVADRCRQYAAKYGVLVANQSDFGIMGS